MMQVKENLPTVLIIFDDIFSTLPQNYRSTGNSARITKFPLQWYVAESDEPPLKYTLSFPIDFAIHY